MDNEQERMTESPERMNDSLERLEEDYRASLYRLDESSRFSIPGRGEVDGTIRAVEPSGRLILEIDGELHGFLFKEIEYIL